MTTDLRNFRCFTHKIQVLQTHLKVTYLHRWNFLTLFFVYMYSVSRTDLMLCFSLLVNRKTHKAKKKNNYKLSGHNSTDNFVKIT